MDETTIPKKPISKELREALLAFRAELAELQREQEACIDAAADRVMAASVEDIDHA